MQSACMTRWQWLVKIWCLSHKVIYFIRVSCCHHWQNNVPLDNSWSALKHSV